MHNEFIDITDGIPDNWNIIKGRIVYLLVYGNTVVYVGSTQQPGRIYSHTHKKYNKIFATNNKTYADEFNYIRKFQPAYNKYVIPGKYPEKNIGYDVALSEKEKYEKDLWCRFRRALSDLKNEDLYKLCKEYIDHYDKP